MNRPSFEVADIIRAAGDNFIEKQRSWLTGLHRKVLSAIERCRTAALGGHRDRCSRCGYTTTVISYNSCRNRNCPKCLNNARKRWLTARAKELLPVPYVHLVFTLPHALVPLFLHNKKLLYALLLRSSAAAVLETAKNPEHLGAEIGFFTVLQTADEKRCCQSANNCSAQNPKRLRRRILPCRKNNPLGYVLTVGGRWS